MQDISIKKKAFLELKILNDKPLHLKNRPPRDVLQGIALRRGIKPVFCLDCGYCIQGRGNVWFKMRINPANCVERYDSTVLPEAL